MEEIMIAKVLGFAAATILFGAGTKIAEYGIKKVEDGFKESKEKKDSASNKDAKYREKIFEDDKTAAVEC
jgi:hypothetical protein